MGTKPSMSRRRQRKPAFNVDAIKARLDEAAAELVDARDERAREPRAQGGSMGAEVREPHERNAP
jgi:hypothetical protein